MANIGFVGLGHMGLPMAINLVRAGHKVIGFDLQTEAMSDFYASGGILANTLQECAQDILITMLQTGAQVQQVCCGKFGLFALLRPDSLFIDGSSIDVSQSRAIHQEALKHQIIAIDAPVSGGVNGARAGTLTIMVGGTKEALAKAMPILTHMGHAIIHAGVAGNGQAAKICNNMILGVTMIAVSEAFILAQNLGLTPQKLTEVVTQSSGNCWVMQHYVPVADVLEQVPANHHYKAGFSAAMMLKDLQLSQHAAHDTKINTPMSQQATQLYQQFNEAGMSELDFSAIIQFLNLAQL